MSPIATTTRGAAKPAATPIYAYAGKLLRVNLSTGKTWTEAWSEADRREYVGNGRAVNAGGSRQAVRMRRGGRDRIVSIVRRKRGASSGLTK